MCQVLDGGTVAGLVGVGTAQSGLLANRVPLPVVKGSGYWLKDAAAIQARSYTSRYFLTAVVVLAYNVRTVTRWLETHPDLEPTPLPDRSNRRRDREHTEPWRFIAATDDDPPDPSIDDGEDERLDTAA